MTRTNEEINAEILAEAKRDAFLEGYLGGMDLVRPTPLVKHTFLRWYRVGDRWRARQHRRMRLFGKIGEAYHRDYPPPELLEHKSYCAQAYGKIKKADIRLGREYHDRRFR